MTKNTRLLALSLLAAGIIGGAALGLAGTANPGWRSHHGVHHINDLNRQMGR
jgi:hypothetical protein